MQELLSFWEISHASYFLFREAILFVSWYSTVITELQFLKERDPERMIPPGAAQYFSFVKGEGAELLVCTDPLMFEC